MQMFEVVTNLKNWNFEMNHKYPLVESEAQAIIEYFESTRPKKYKVEKKTMDGSGNWYEWGVYDEFSRATNAANELARCSGVIDVRITEV